MIALAFVKNAQMRGRYFYVALVSKSKAALEKNGLFVYNEQ